MLISLLLAALVNLTFLLKRQTHANYILQTQIILINLVRFPFLDSFSG